MTLRAIFFDLDGTLVDSNALHVRAWQQAFSETGAPLDRDAIHGQIGKGADMLVPTLRPDMEVAAQRRLGERCGEIFKARYLDRVTPFAGARDLLERVHSAGLQVVLASSASAAELDRYLELLDAHELVSATTSADDVVHTKPAPDIFAAALAKVAPLGPDEVLVVGDTPYDVEAAAKCGIATVAVRSGGFPDAVLQEAGAIAVYDDVAALLAGYDQSPLARGVG